MHVTSKLMRSVLPSKYKRNQNHCQGEDINCNLFQLNYMAFEGCYFLAVFFFFDLQFSVGVFKLLDFT